MPARMAPTPTTTPDAPSSTGSGTTLSDVADAYWDQSASHHVYDALHDLIAGSDDTKVQFAAGRRPDAARADAGADLGGGAQHDLDPDAGGDARRARWRARSGADASFFWQPTVFTKKLLPDEQRYLALDSYEPARWDPATQQVREQLPSTPFVDLGGALDVGDHAGALGLRAHERGGRPPRRGCDLREPAAATAAARSRRCAAVKILGISAFYHDSAAALVVDGELVAAAQEERFTRKKHDAAFPEHAIAYCLRRGDVGARRARRGRLLRQADHHVRPAAEDLPARRPEGHPARSRRRCRTWTREKLWIPYEIERGLQAHRLRRCRRTCGSPSTTRATPPARSSRRRSSAPAILTFDGVGEWATSSVGVGRGQPHRAAAPAQLPALARPPLLGVHLLLRLPGELGRVQAHGPRPVRRARLRRRDPRAPARPAATTARSAWTWSTSTTSPASR